MFRNILVAIDSSAEAEAALEEAVDLARRDGARLVLIHVVAPPRWRSSGLQYVPYPSHEELQSEAERVVTRAEQLVPRDVPVSTVARVGRPAAEIVTRAECGGHDLVVMGSRGHGAVGQLLFGTVSRAVIKRSPVPVLVTGRRRERSRRGGAERRVGRTVGAGHSTGAVAVHVERATMGERALLLWLVAALLLELQLVLWMLERMYGS